MQNLISVIIVNWNHGHLLQTCLEALLRQEYAPLEITVVDNGSHDGSADLPGFDLSRVHVQRFAQNQGFSRAFNWGVRHTSANLVLSLNPDTEVKPGFLLELARALEKSRESDGRVGMVAPKLLRSKPEAPAVLDSTGLFVDRRRRPYDRGQGELDRGQYDEQPHVFGACGAAALYWRPMLEDLAPDGEYLDEDFFAYYEDADLAWRAHLRDWRAIYAPLAVATHVRGWGDTLRRRGRAAKDASGPRLALRNRYLMTIKNDALSHFLIDLPFILAAELPRLAYAAIAKPRALLGLADLVAALPAARRKRRQIRSRQTVDHAAVRPWFLASAGRGGVPAPT